MGKLFRTLLIWWSEHSAPTESRNEGFLSFEESLARNLLLVMHYLVYQLSADLYSKQLANPKQAPSSTAHQATSAHSESTPSSTSTSILILQLLKRNSNDVLESLHASPESTHLQIFCSGLLGLFSELLRSGLLAFLIHFTRFRENPQLENAFECMRISLYCLN